MIMSEPIVSETVKSIDPSKAVEKAVAALESRVKIFADQMSEAFNQMYNHAESMAAHIIALESVVGQLAAKANISQGEVEKWIDARVSKGTDGKGSSLEAQGVALDILGIKPLYDKK